MISFVGVYPKEVKQQQWQNIMLESIYYHLLLFYILLLLYHLLLLLCSINYSYNWVEKPSE